MKRPTWRGLVNKDKSRVPTDYANRSQPVTDASKQPKELVSYYFDRAKAGAGIYEWNGNTLRWRVADDVQPLSFTDGPAGFWNEYELIRISAHEANAAIKALQDERLQIKASTP